MNAQSAPLTERKYYLPFVLVTSLFFLWAIGVNLNDVLIPHLKKACELTDETRQVAETLEAQLGLAVEFILLLLPLSLDCVLLGLELALGFFTGRLAHNREEISPTHLL